MDRVGFVNHKGKEVLVIDFSVAGKQELLQTMDAAKKIISGQPENSVLTLTKVAGSSFDSEVSKALKEYVKSNKPYVKSAAVVGLGGLQKILYDTVINFTGRKMATFNNIEEAMDWLVKQ
ncbi:MAG: hypothetical protein ACOY31_12130 [Bacillota bacterium]